MTGLFCLVFGLAAGWWIEHRRHQTIAERAYWDGLHREDIDRLLTRCDTAENAFGRALTLARKTRRRRPT